MLLNVVSLLVGFLCLFVVLLMLFNQKPNRIINGYLIAILIVVGLQRFLYAIEVLGFTANTYSPLKIKPLLAFYIVPVYYLFFSRLIHGKGQLKKELLHFIAPTAVIALNLVVAEYAVNRVLYLVFSLTYFGLILAIVKQFIFRKSPSLIDKMSFHAVRRWVLLMVVVTFLLIIYSNSISFQGLYFQLDLGTFYQYSSLVWCGLLLYMFKNPVIIFGKVALLKDIPANELHDFQIWSHKPLKAIEEKDKIVYHTVLNRVDSILLEIKALQKPPSILDTTTLNAETLAKELKTPKRHLDFIFKYYCHYSVNDYSNLVKINYALSLINDGYLEKYTVASLGEKCLFNSRFTFSKNFKKFIGVSVSDFVSSNANGINPELLDHLIHKESKARSTAI